MATPMQYPSYEALDRTKSATGSLAFCRLRWYLKGSVSESIRILEDPTDPASAQEPYQTANGLHPISTASITEPPVSSIEVSVDALNVWAEGWDELHDGGEGEGDDEDDGLGQRPPPGPTLKVEADAGQFVTIGKFIELVHPWLIDRKDQIRAAIGVLDMEPIPEAADIALLCASPTPIMLIDSRTSSQALFDDALAGASVWARNLQERQRRAAAAA